MSRVSVVRIVYQDLFGTYATYWSIQFLHFYIIYIIRWIFLSHFDRFLSWIIDPGADLLKLRTPCSLCYKPHVTCGPLLTWWQCDRVLDIRNCRFSHDVTKIQTTKLSILVIFNFHDVQEQLKTNIHTNFCSEWLLGFVIDYARFLSFCVTRHLYDCWVG